MLALVNPEQRKRKAWIGLDLPGMQDICSRQNTRCREVFCVNIRVYGVLNSSITIQVAWKTAW